MRIISLALSFDSPISEGSSNAKHHKLNDGCQASNDKEVGIIRGDNSKPIRVKVFEDGNSAKVDKGRPCEIC